MMVSQQSRKALALRQRNCSGYMPIRWHADTAATYQVSKFVPSRVTASSTQWDLSAPLTELVSSRLLTMRLRGLAGSDVTLETYLHSDAAPARSYTDNA